MFKTSRLLILAALASAISASAQAPRTKAPPSLWMAPSAMENGKALRSLFEHPEDWKETRSRVDVLFYTDLNFQRQFSDDELWTWFGQLKEWHIKLALEVGAVKEWGKTGEKTFKAEKPMWERLERLGADLYAIGMDEPLVNAREKIHESDEYAMQETANYIELVRQHFPKLLIGDVESYPSISVEEHDHWITGLQKKLADMKVRGLDFYRLDVDWIRFTVQNRGSWKEVKQIEQLCRQKGLPFSLIYWSSGYPSMEKRGLADDSTWYTALMQQGYDYVAVGGAPDHYVIESWLNAPARTLPETGEWTFTRSVRDFAQKFIKREK